jgi:hypothetical protein
MKTFAAKYISVSDRFSFDSDTSKFSPYVKEKTTDLHDNDQFVNAV